MEFYFIDKSKFIVTDYSYIYFDVLVKKHGFKIEKNDSLHNYFEWRSVLHWSFKYDAYEEENVCKLFSKSINLSAPLNFFVRLKSHLPLIKISYEELSNILFDLIHETGIMGWEAISEDGKYILEFTDAYEHLAKSNFQILQPLSHV